MSRHYPSASCGPGTQQPNPRDAAAALDNWAAAFTGDAKRTAKLRAVAVADPDPRRNEVRDAVAWGDRYGPAPPWPAAPPSPSCPIATLLPSGGGPPRRWGSSDETVAVLDAGRRRYPGDFWLNHELGRAFGASAPRREEAVPLPHCGHCPPPRFARGTLNLGLALSVQGKLDAAIAEYRRAIKLKPDFALAHFNLGVALSDQGKLDEAIAEYRRAIVIRPDYADAYNNLGLVLSAQGGPRGNRRIPPRHRDQA